MTAPQQSPETELALMAALAAAQSTAADLGGAVAEQMQQVPTIARVAATAGRLRQRLTTATTRLLEDRWADVDPWSGTSVQSFVDDGWDTLVQAQRQVVDLAAAEQLEHLDALGEHVDVTPTVPDEVRGLHTTASKVTVVDNRDSAPRSKVSVVDERDTPPRRSRVVVIDRGADVLNRPARTARVRVTEGASPEAADAAARVRIRSIVDQNLSLAQREAEHQVIATAAAKRKSKIFGWRRMVHPELSRGGSCGLCIAASTRIYGVATLKPIHNGCNCVPVAVTVDHDPGAIITEADLGSLYSDAGGTGRDLKRTRYQVDEHGELGAVLAPKKRAGTGGGSSSGSVPRATVTPPADLTPDDARKRLASIERRLDDLRSDDFSYAQAIGRTAEVRKAAEIAMWESRVRTLRSVIDAH